MFLRYRALEHCRVTTATILLVRFNPKRLDVPKGLAETYSAGKKILPGQTGIVLLAQEVPLRYTARAPTLPISRPSILPLHPPHWISSTALITIKQQINAIFSIRNYFFLYAVFILRTPHTSCVPHFLELYSRPSSAESSFCGIFAQQLSQSRASLRTFCVYKRRCQFSLRYISDSQTSNPCDHLLRVRIHVCSTH